MTVLVTRGLGRNGGLYVSFGLGANPLPDEGGGRHRPKRRRRLFFEGFELHLDFGSDIEKKLSTEMLDVLGVPMLPPIADKAPALQDVIDPVEREIAKLARVKEVREHGIMQQKRLQLLQLLDMELYFMVLALLDEDF